MITSMVFALLTGSAGPHYQCDTQFIHRTLRQIQIADYDPSATPPPPTTTARLYASLADKVAECADSPQHFMDSKITDLLQASNFAVLSADDYFKAHNIAGACPMLNEARRLSRLARAARPLSDQDELALKAHTGQEVRVRNLLGSKCPSESNVSNLSGFGIERNAPSSSLQNYEYALR